ncbi:MAG: aminoacyl-tRNA hydrolase [Calditrichae bacterium]|nr:aminoacyl-tRNA hydrolase [Calditrichota bacterium]MCB9058790.1 aminoacyl-tRNA hydrolase [Calditrichia bacterium]
MFCIVGLGNPGRKYILTRHNAGFLVLDNIADALNIPFSPGKGDYYFLETELEGKSAILIKPSTYMNNSGLIFQQLENNFNFKTDKLLVVYDDFHLPFGTIRFRSKGSDAGHNGIKSIIYHLQSDHFSRLRIGIGSDFVVSIDHVLSPFNSSEMTNLQDILDEAFSGIKTWMKNGIHTAMNNHNRNVLDRTR